MHYLFGLVLGHVGDVDRVLLAAEPLLVLMNHLHAVPCDIILVKGTVHQNSSNSTTSAPCFGDKFFVKRCGLELCMLLLNLTNSQLNIKLKLYFWGFWS